MPETVVMEMPPEPSTRFVREDRPTLTLDPADIMAASRVSLRRSVADATIEAARLMSLRGATEAERTGLCSLIESLVKALVLV